MPMVALALLVAAQNPAYLDPNVPIHERAIDLVSRMTVAEKVSQMQHEAPAIPRLGIPAYTWWNEALHGAVGNPVTVYPQAIGLAASFDTQLIGRVASAISDEGRARYEWTIRKRGFAGMHEGLDFWAPNINIFRDPRWGRGQETYGEDPFLTGRMAVTYVRALQGERGGRFKAIATPKHFAVHSGPDPERHHFNAVADPRDMWNTYLPAFRAAVTEGGAWSVMSAYSALNGEPDSASKTLLQRILRDDWGFQGYVVSDCGAIDDLFNGHHLAPTQMEADVLAVKAGCDLECGNSYRLLEKAVDQGLVTQASLDTSLTRLFEARIRLGMFDKADTGPWKKLPESVIDSPEHRQLALEAARKSIVLLKNDGILPLQGGRKIAVIGPTADDREIALGNYNGTPSHTVSVFEGLKTQAPRQTEIRYVQGSGLLSSSNPVSIPGDVLKGGVSGDYFAGRDFRGPVLKHTQTPNLDLNWGDDAPFAGFAKDDFCARFTTTLVPKVSGTYSIGTNADDGTRLYINDKLVVDDWNEHAASPHTAEVALEAGKSYAIRVDYFESKQQASVRLVWAPPVKSNFADAVNLAKWSDTTVMVLGINGQVENEERDRTSIELPAPQQALLRAVLATGKPVVVVLENGSCLSVDDRRIRGLVEAWYPGEQGGNAVAEVLFGRTNPGGRLPVTFYRSLDQVPAFSNYKMDGRTYRYFKGKPLYPFGYGLSYTTFRYDNVKVERLTSGRLEAQAWVRNTGDRTGDEVVQVYAARQGAVWPEPTRKLVGFARAHLRPGEGVSIRIPIRDEALAQADGSGNMKVLPGRYTFSVGGGQPGGEPATSGKAGRVNLTLAERAVQKPRQAPIGSTFAASN